MSILTLLFSISIPFILYLAPMVGWVKVVYKLDLYSPFWIFSLLFGLGILLFVKLSKDFYKWLKEILIDDKKSFIVISIIALIYVFFSLTFIEGRSRVETDESLYLTTAQNLYYNQVGIHCVEGTFLEYGLTCVIMDSIKPRGLSYLYMLGMPIFGTDLYWVYNFHTFLFFLTIPIFFLALTGWMPKGIHTGLPLLAATILASTPILLFQFRSASIESLYVFMFSLSLLFLKWAFDRNTIRHWILLALTLAFFAQTRTETVLCLFAFIGVVAYRCGIFPSIRGVPNGRGVFRIINSQFAIFLATLSFFSIPVLCTLSLNRNHDLQGGAYGAHFHLFENIIANFKITALPHYAPYGLLEYPFFPYLIWFAILGLITLIILAIKKFKTYKYLILFLLLLSPQYIFLFDGVSADFNLTIQQRFALVILPMMSFLNALFITQILSLFKNRGTPSEATELPQAGNSKILKIGVQIIILAIVANTLIHYESFRKNIMYKNDTITQEKAIISNWLKMQPNDKKLFFYFNTVLTLAHGNSTYNYDNVIDFDSLDVAQMLDEYNNEVYVISGSGCKNNLSHPKMVVSGMGRMCGRFDNYFDTKIVLDTTFGIRDLKISQLIGIKDKDPKGLLRLHNLGEEQDSLLSLYYNLPEKDSYQWKVQKFVNDSLIEENPYSYGKYVHKFNLNLFKVDTNQVDFRIIDMLSGDTVHSDNWRLLRKW